MASCADADGVWYDVIEGRSARSSVDSVSEAGAWRAEEWLNAFVVLVSATFTPGALPCPVANPLEKVLTLGTFSWSQFFERPLAYGDAKADDLLFFVFRDVYQVDNDTGFESPTIQLRCCKVFATNKGIALRPAGSPCALHCSTEKSQLTRGPRLGGKARQKDRLARQCHAQPGHPDSLRAHSSCLSVCLLHTS